MITIMMINKIIWWSPQWWSTWTRWQSLCSWIWWVSLHFPCVHVPSLSSSLWQLSLSLSLSFLCFIIYLPCMFRYYHHLPGNCHYNPSSLFTISFIYPAICMFFHYHHLPGNYHYNPSSLFILLFIYPAICMFRHYHHISDNYHNQYHCHYCFLLFICPACSVIISSSLWQFFCTFVLFST